MTDGAHIYPGGDRESHDLENPPQCPCGIRLIQVKQVNGRPVAGTLYVHAVLDPVKELPERDAMS